MVSPLRRLLVVLALIALFATACSSSSDGAADVASTDDTSTESADSADPGATSIPVPEDDAGAEAAIEDLQGLDGIALEEPTEDPTETARSWVQQRLNICLLYTSPSPRDRG